MKQKKQSWVVTIRRTVKTELVLDNCTEDDANSDPYLYCIEERDLDNEDWEILSCEPNE